MCQLHTGRVVRVVSTVGLNESQLRRIRSVSPRVEMVQVANAQEAILRQLGDVEVLIAHWGDTGFDPVLAPNLRWVQLNTASVERVFAQPIINTDVVFTNCSGIHAVPIAEYMLTSMLAFTRKFPELLRRQQNRHWSTSAEVFAGLVSGELRGSTLGILGYGSIGREVGRLGHCFGMQVLACKRDPSVRIDTGWSLPGVGDPDGSIPAAFYGHDSLSEFLGACDYVALACPLTPETRGIIGEAALRSMRPNAYLVNIARGALIDEGALLRALREGWIAGAGLDVAVVEPLRPESEFFDLANVILTPHCSGTTTMYDERATDFICLNLQRYLAGEPLLNVISRERGY